MIAGAGSGKTTVMAARVVWLVATGLVAPQEVLGLTFTTKATHELATRIRDALRAAGILRPPGDRALVDPREPAAEEPEEPEEPTVATYNAYAASLLTEHGLRIGHEPDTRVVADASRYQLAARVIARHRGHVELLSDHPATVIDNLLALDSAMSEHLVGPADVRTFQDRPGRRSRPRGPRRPARRRPTWWPRCSTRSAAGTSCSTWWSPTGGSSDDLGLMDFSDQIELGARLADTAARRRGASSGQVPGGAARRVPGHLGGPGADAQPALLRARPRRTAAGTPSARSATPTRRSTAGAGASVSNIIGFGHDFPASDGSDDVPTYPLSVNRRSDARILRGRQRPRGTALRAVRARCASSSRSRGRSPATVRVAVHETYDEELAWLPAQVQAAHRGDGGAVPGGRSGC